MKRFLCFLAAAALFAVAAPVSSPAAVIVYEAHLDGPSEFPPVASPGVGFARVAFDPVAHLLHVFAEFSGLVGTTTVAHIHGPTAIPGEGTMGVAVTPGTLPGFPVGVTSGVYSVTLDTLATSTYTAAFLTGAGGTEAGAEARLATMLAEGRAYFNIHTNFAPGGEIRGFLQQAVPEPGSGIVWALGLLGALGYAGFRRTRATSRPAPSS